MDDNTLLRPIDAHHTTTRLRWLSFIAEANLESPSRTSFTSDILNWALLTNVLVEAHYGWVDTYQASNQVSVDFFERAAKKLVTTYHSLSKEILYDTIVEGLRKASDRNMVLNSKVGLLTDEINNLKNMFGDLLLIALEHGTKLPSGQIAMRRYINNYGQETLREYLPKKEVEA